jgi:dipeptidyl aminopeptidase/acylaminoacyl peptidase
MLLPLSLALFGVFGQEAKKPLDHSVYDGWKSIRGAALSDDGAWFVYGVYPQEGDGVLNVVSTASATKAAFTVEHGTGARFSHDGRFLIVTQTPKFADAKKARIAKAKPEDQPKDVLVVIELASGKRFTHERVSSWKLAEEDSGWLAYKLEPVPTPTPAPSPNKSVGTKPTVTPKPSESVEVDTSTGEEEDQRGRRGGGVAAAAAPGPDAATIKPGDTWVLRNLASGQEVTLPEVSDAVFNKTGTTLAFATASKEAAKDGVSVRDLRSGSVKQVLAGEGHYKDLVLSEDGREVGFMTDRDDLKAKPVFFSLYSASTSGAKASLRVKLGTAGIPKDWTPADAPLSFSADGRRLFFGSMPKPAPEVKSEIPDEDKASLDIWNWQDDRLQTQQLIELNGDKNRTYLAYVDVKSGQVVQLGTPVLRAFAVPDKGRAPALLLATDVPYFREQSWSPGFADLYRIDAATGRAVRLLQHKQFDLAQSPDGKFGLSFDLAAKTLTSYDLHTGRAVPIPLPEVPFVDERDDHLDVAPMYGVGGWLKDGRALLYDRYDIWAIDPSTGGNENLTHGTGRRRNLIFRVTPVSVDRETSTVDLSKAILLEGRNEDNQSTGAFELAHGDLKELSYGEHALGGFLKAKDAPVVAYTESTFREYPDYWLTDTRFSSPVRVSDANPQQAQYRWGDVEQISWLGNDGQTLQGLLYKPDGFDRRKQYPMITYYYERNVETRYNYLAPVPSASVINIPYFVSNGYCVFVPDIDYKIGYPGPSAYSAIVSGVQAILAKGFVDPKRLGLQGQSWGGYQTAYLVTQTNLFACASAGAPVGDMFSAYGGIRYGAGIVRQFQYEHTQTRIGGTPWERPLQYLENSPVFAADRVNTPLLIMSNDKDGAVPHTQGIEFFVDLRRLNKPSWLLVYNDEDHNLTMRKNRKDLSVRLAQFFDHYLKGTPMPVWMSRGVPALDKGKDYGFDLPKP